MPGPGTRTFWSKIMRQLLFRGPGGPIIRLPSGKCSLQAGATGSQSSLIDRSSLKGDMAMKIAVVGTGALGSLYAGYLARSGEEIFALDVKEEII